MAVVGENIITKGEFFYQLSTIANQRGISPSQTPLKYERLANAVLEDIIDRYVLLEYAKMDSNIVVDNDEVQLQLDNQIDMFIQMIEQNVILLLITTQRIPLLHVIFLQYFHQ